MLKINSWVILALFVSALFVSCEQEDTTSHNDDTFPETVTAIEDVSLDVLTAIENAGFNITNQPPIKYEDRYIVEGDIMLTYDQIMTMSSAEGVTNASKKKQYSTDNLVTTAGNRTISIYVSTSFSGAYVDAVDLAIDRYNDENLELTFQRVTSSGDADISLSRLNWFYEFFGVLGSAGFPTSSGDPYDEILMNGRLFSSYGYSLEAVTTVIAHEMGHCIGFRHTDYFDRSVSCGGSTDDEGDGGVGANHIPGTPTGASVSAGSWMLSCSDGGDRPFNSDDQIALDYLY